MQEGLVLPPPWWRAGSWRITKPEKSKTGSEHRVEAIVRSAGAAPGYRPARRGKAVPNRASLGVMPKESTTKGATGKGLPTPKPSGVVFCHGRGGSPLGHEQIIFIAGERRAALAGGSGFLGCSTSNNVSSHELSIFIDNGTTNLNGIQMSSLWKTRRRKKGAAASLRFSQTEGSLAMV